MFSELLANSPHLTVLDIQAVKQVTDKYDIPYVVDATCTAGLVKPFDEGADIVTYSLTKWYGGHGNVLGGEVLARRNFKWNARRLPHFSKPCPHTGFIHAKNPYQNPFIARLRSVMLFYTGAPLSAECCYKLIDQIKTLPMRIQHITSTTQKVANALASNEKIADDMCYPGLSTHADYNVAERYRLHGGPLLFFSLKDNRAEKGQQFISALKLITHTVSIGGGKSLITHPVSTTHLHVPEEERDKLGLRTSTLRLSLGLEAVEDILWDIEQAFKTL